MPAIAERDPRKIGLRTPKTGIPIISESDARLMNPAYFFVGPWHFREEIVHREKLFLDGGGRIVFPLPKFEIIDRESSASSTKTNQINWAKPLLFEDERAYVDEALNSTMISGGHFVDQFERRFSDLIGHPEPAVSTNNGTTAIQLAYLTLGVGAGDEVIVPAWGFMAAANMALAVGATPVFADIDEETWMIDPDDVAAKISKKTKAIVAIHTYGPLCDMARLKQIAKDAGVALIEDCAESLGTTWNERSCGLIGDIGTFSFQATKTITCGEGGAVVFRDPEMSAKARLIRNHGMSGRKRYWHHVIGHNFRLPNLQCAMLCAQLTHWPEIVDLHARLHEAYRLRLGDIPGLRFQKISPESAPVMWAVGLRLEHADAVSRDHILDRLMDKGIECRPGFYPPSAQPIYHHLATTARRAEKIADQVIVPPIDPTLPDRSFDYICDSFRSILKELKYG
jgi:perosamine synthetase